MSYFGSRVLVGVFFLGVPAVHVVRGSVPLEWLGVAAGVAGLALAVSYGLASGLKCGTCEAPLLLDNGMKKHANARVLPGFNHRARVAWDVVFRKNWKCMYCGASGGAWRHAGAGRQPVPVAAEPPTAVRFPEPPRAEQAPPAFVQLPDEPAGKRPVIASPFAVVSPPGRTAEAALREPRVDLPADETRAPFPASGESAPAPAPDQISEEAGATLPPPNPEATPPVMNRHTTPPDHSSPNPFLAAAASVPPPSPLLPPLGAHPGGSSEAFGGGDSSAGAIPPWAMSGAANGAPAGAPARLVPPESLVPPMVPGMLGAAVPPGGPGPLPGVMPATPNGLPAMPPVAPAPATAGVPAMAVPPVSAGPLPPVMSTIPMVPPEPPVGATGSALFGTPGSPPAGPAMPAVSLPPIGGLPPVPGPPPTDFLTRLHETSPANGARTAGHAVPAFEMPAPPAAPTPTVDTGAVLAAMEDCRRSLAEMIESAVERLERKLADQMAAVPAFPATTPVVAVAPVVRADAPTAVPAEPQAPTPAVAPAVPRPRFVAPDPAVRQQLHATLAEAFSPPARPAPSPFTVLTDDAGWAGAAGAPTAFPVPEADPLDAGGFAWARPARPAGSLS